MGTVYDSFEKELAAREQRYSQSAKDELIALCLLALEREELVAIGYREDVLSPRLASLRVPADVRDIIQHALIWTWKDEEMHAIYIRGAILKLGSWSLRFSAFSHQIAGAIGGWSTSVRQHVRWSSAPISRAAATIIAAIGALFGKVPREVRRHLTYGSFHSFCRFNVDAEKTAALCWKRMAELASRIPDLPSNTLSDFLRVQADEERHGRVFTILAEALSENDELVDGETAQSLRLKIGDIGEFFLPRNMRPQFTARNPLGSGSAVWVSKGTRLDHKLTTFRQLLDDSCLIQHLRDRARETGKRDSEMKIAIKPTFMLGYDRRDTSMITDPALLEDLAKYLRNAGYSDIAVVEARNIYDQFFQARTVRDVAAYFGIDSPHYRIVDGSEEQEPYAYVRGFAQYTVSRTWKGADFRISFGKMRSHPIELAYLTVGNVEWMGGRCDEFIFVERQAQRETAIMMLLDAFPPHYSILDAYESAADGLVGVMGCPEPKRPMRFYAGTDALAVDTVAARHMGLKDSRRSSLLRAAAHWFGSPTDDIRVIGSDQPLSEWRSPYHNEISTLLSLAAFPVYVMGSGRGSMFLPPMDLSTFPFIHAERLHQRLGRTAMRWLLGLRLPGRGAGAG